jgi:hypothetical protein
LTTNTPYKVDYQLDPRDLLNRQVGRLLALEDLVDIDRGLAKFVCQARPIRHEPTGFNILPALEHSGQPRRLDKLCDPIPMCNDRWIRDHHDPIDTLHAQTSECPLQLVF